MVRSSKGFRAGTRRKLKRGIKRQSKLKRTMQEFKPKDKIIIIQNSSVHKGMPHPRFKGAVGRIIKKTGSSYLIEIRDKDKPKLILSAPEHLKGHVKGKKK